MRGRKSTKATSSLKSIPRPYKAALDQATAQKAEDVAQLQSAQLDLQRYQDLAKNHFAPIQQVDDQQATVNKYIGAVAADDAMIETAQINLGYCVIRAPFDGRVSLYQVDVGNIIQTASETGIVSITQDKPISVVFTLPEADLLRVQTAQAKGTVPVEVLASDDQQQLASGTLLTPNNTIDTSSGTISLKATFANKRRPSVARPVRQHPRAGRYAAQGRHHARRRRAARTRRPVRLRRQAGPDGRPGHRSGRLPGQRPHGDHQGPIGQRDRRRYRPIALSPGTHVKTTAAKTPPSPRGTRDRRPLQDARDEHFHAFHSPADRHIAC